MALAKNDQTTAVERLASAAREAGDIAPPWAQMAAEAIDELGGRVDWLAEALDPIVSRLEGLADTPA